MRQDSRKTLTLTDLAHNPTLRGMTAVVMNQISIFSLGGTSINWKTETALSMTNNKGFGTSEVKSGQNLIVLLTGATGFLGLNILAQLVGASEVAVIHCVAVRSPGKVVQHLSSTIVAT